MDRLFGVSGTQKKVESVTLITDATCLKHDRIRSWPNFGQLSRVSMLSWKGIGRWKELEALKNCIINSRKQLKSLTLDFIDQNMVHAIYSRDFPRQTDPENDILPSTALGLNTVLKIEDRLELESLALSSLPFHIFQWEFANMFTLSKLRHLKLSTCPSSLGVLQSITHAITKPENRLNLQSFEIKIIDESFEASPSSEEQGPKLIVAKFLATCGRLEDLFISLPGVDDWDSIFKAILNYQNSVKRLVFDAVAGIEHQDHRLMFPIPWSSSLDEVFQLHWLQAIGLSWNIDDLEDYLLSSENRPSAPLIHLRGNFYDDRYSLIDPDEQYDDLYYEPQLIMMTNHPAVKIGFSSDWQGSEYQRAFSAEGIPKLKILARGAFNYDMRRADDCLLLGRFPGFEGQRGDLEYEGFRSLEETDETYWEVVEKNWDFLTACAVEGLMQYNSSPN
ncbi:MAG: hypothetical protein Q9227_000126 [Pyrenula ochraceoflavens]